MFYRVRHIYLVQTLIRTDLIQLLKHRTQQVGFCSLSTSLLLFFALSSQFSLVSLTDSIFIKYYNKQIMLPFQEATKINDYNNLIEKLLPLGKFQIQVYLVCIAYWCLAGCLKTIFDLCFVKLFCPFGLIFSEFVGIIVVCQLASRMGHKKAGLISSLFLIVGILLIIINQGNQNKVVGSVGISILSMSTMSRPCLLLCNVAEYTTLRIVQITVSLAILGYSICKFLSVFIIQLLHGEDDILVLYCYLLPICLLSLGLWYFVTDSPRYLIQNDIIGAEKLLRKICQINGVKSDQVITYIEDSFIIKLINIRIYDFRVLFKYDSLGFSQYCLIIMMVLLGLIYDFPKQAMFGEDPAYRQMKIIWESTFQLIGILTTFMSIKIGRRQFYLKLMSIIIALLSTSMFLINYFCQDQSQSFCPYYKFITLGLNSVFSITLYVFLLICAIQFYPHSIRVLGLGALISFFYFGKLISSLYNYLQITDFQKAELFLFGSWGMAIHSFRAPETFCKGFHYQISEVEEDQRDDI